MKIWIFAPSKNWNYCGGFSIAIAASFEKAVEMLRGASGNEHFYRSENDIKDETGIYQWVLEKSFELAGSPQEETLINCNWS